MWHFKSDCKLNYKKIISCIQELKVTVQSEKKGKENIENREKKREHQRMG